MSIFEENTHFEFSSHQRVFISQNGYQMIGFCSCVCKYRTALQNSRKRNSQVTRFNLAYPKENANQVANWMLTKMIET
jgi:hypothetical protein